MSRPPAPVVAVHVTRPDWLSIPGCASLSLVVACPWCGRTHTHGGSPHDRDHGTRRPHCGDRRGEYRITDPDRLVPTFPQALRHAYAGDRCACGHDRRVHYQPDGSTARCSECSCSAYGWDGAA